MKIKEELKQLRTKNIGELTKNLDKEYSKLREEKFARGFRKLKDLRAIKKTKEKIARIWTVIGEEINAKAQNRRNR